MHVNRLWPFVLAVIFTFGLPVHSSAFAAGKDKDKQSKRTKVVIKSNKTPNQFALPLLVQMSLLLLQDHHLPQHWECAVNMMTSI